MSWVVIDTIPLLQQAQDALELAEQTDDRELRNAAESVLSALVVVLRKKQAKVPATLTPHIALLRRRMVDKVP